MLSARKLHLLAGLKVDQTDLRTRELNFYMARFIAIASVSSIMTCLAYVGLIKIKIPELKQVGSAENHGGSWEVTMFYVSAGLTIAFSMFNLFLTSFMVVNAQGLSLRGPPGSVARCVEICKENWLLVRLMLSGSLVSIFMAAISIVWMKHDWQTCVEEEGGSGEEGEPGGHGGHGGHGGGEPGGDGRRLHEPEPPEKLVCTLSPHVISAIVATVIFVGLFASMVRQMRQISRYLAISDSDIVAGDLTIATTHNDRLDIVAEGEESIPAAR